MLEIHGKGLFFEFEIRAIEVIKFDDSGNSKNNSIAVQSIRSLIAGKSKMSTCSVLETIRPGDFKLLTNCLGISYNR